MSLTLLKTFVKVMGTKTYRVTYSPKRGGTKTLLVKATSYCQAIANASNICHTGKNFRDLVEASDNYLKPRKQGFQGKYQLRYL